MKKALIFVSLFAVVSAQAALTQRIAVQDQPETVARKVRKDSAPNAPDTEDHLARKTRKTAPPA